MVINGQILRPSSIAQDVPDFNGSGGFHAKDPVDEATLTLLEDLAEVACPFARKILFAAFDHVASKGAF